jgi:hypothetical protein
MWWVLAPAAWIWQYCAYIPAHLIWFYVFGGSIKVDWRPWFLDRLRGH